MSTEAEMTIDERRKYLRKMQKRYRQADRKVRGLRLDQPPENPARRLEVGVAVQSKLARLLVGSL